MKKTLNRPVGILALLFAGTDLAIKLVPLGHNRVILPGLLGIHQTQNQGVAFGMLSGIPWFQTVLIAMILLISGLWLYRRPLTALQSLGLGMMMGGALGNLIDRLLHGAVQDYLQLLFMVFPVFNAADVFVTLGAGILVVELLLDRQTSV